MLRRLFDILFSFLGLLILSPVLLILIIIGYFDTGSPIFKQKRIGKYQRSFILYKIRTMKINTASNLHRFVDFLMFEDLVNHLRLFLGHFLLMD